MASLYDQLGGQTTIDRLVDDFYGRVLQDPLLGPVFEGVDRQRLYGHQKRFLGMALGGEVVYSGRDLGPAHAAIAQRHGLDDRHFDAVIGHLAGSMETLGVSEPIRAQVIRVAESTRAAVLGRAMPG